MKEPQTDNHGQDREFDNIVDQCLEQIGPEESQNEQNRRRPHRNKEYKISAMSGRKFSRRQLIAAGLAAFFIVNFVAYMVLSGGPRPIPRQEADAKLKFIYGNGYKQIEAVNAFLSPSRRFYSPTDPAFSGAVQTLNEVFYEDGNSHEQGFSSDYFFFLGKGIVYTEPVGR